MARRLCETKGLGPEWLAGVAGVAESQCPVPETQRDQPVSQDSSAPCREQTRSRKPGHTDRRVAGPPSRTSSPRRSPRPGLLSLALLVLPWMWHRPRCAKVGPCRGEILEQLVSNTCSSDVVTQRKTPRRAGKEEGAGV